ncbi:Gfo/Idh/MocA family protein [Streptococcus uberis]|uniref:Gfo/Idh/MocA family protein n=1 Tax=Streptococcus uberis TaxID=1349 RepID=UPI00062045A1|nr:Gfo/Idh/MocA family oxidoreductase [Streptococcus uberis]KKF44920.1 NAD(P)-dependent oxidoreductase [Streptococcus uberis C9359]KKF54658.1 NAD(P)-dependent oxidoreductase [Streptococcus uberis C5388]MBY4765270.1 Gfo/Idh/MocA family oxidoreductase [Streptococcus uberis]
MKLGIIGTGIIVQEFLPKLVKIEGIEVLGLQGIPQEMDLVKQLAAENGVAHAVSDFEALAALAIDTVYVAVPNFLHMHYSKQALQRGLNVIVEKPATSNDKELLELKGIAKENDVFIFEAVTTPYLKGFAKIKEWLPEIGDIKLVQSQYSQYSRRYDAFKEGIILPAFDPQKSGGALMDLNLYNLHFVMGLFGQPLSSTYLANMEKAIDTSGILSMTYPSFQALCIAAKDSKGMTGALIQGDKGLIRTFAPANAIGKVVLEKYDGTVLSFEEDSFENRLIPEFTEFITAINTKDQEFYEEAMARSLAVSRLQTQARLANQIIFPADQA